MLHADRPNLRATADERRTSAGRAERRLIAPVTSGTYHVIEYALRTAAAEPVA
jgi:hypothetical protein